MILLKEIYANMIIFYIFDQDDISLSYKYDITLSEIQI